ncbi:glycosyltransferase family 4 protein [Candidatus Kuenenbacteria bacterium]|nr:glycosyltransferase family 4 protein [Candidatus Kuenenbacteria bacterium]
MKRTLLVTIDFPPMFGGVANYWANLCRCMPSDSFVVLAQEYDNSLDFDIKQNYLIYRKNLISNNKWLWPKWLPLLYQTYKLIRSENIKKLVVGHVLPTGTVAYILKKLLRVPYLVSIHGLDIAIAQQNKRKKWLMRKVFSQAEKIITNSNYTKEQLLKLDCCVKDDVVVVYPCPNKTLGKGSEEFKQRVFQNNNLQNKKIILTVGRLVERKGHDKVIEAMPEILEKIPNAVYIIVGQGKQLSDLKTKAEEIQVKDKVLFFTDMMDNELPTFYELADVFIMPSRQLANGDVEGFGIVYLEANIYAKPAIAGKSGGAVEAVEHNLNGLLVDPLNINEISQAIVSVLENQTKAKELGERGRERVIEKFNWEKQAAELVKILS